MSDWGKLSADDLIVHIRSLAAHLLSWDFTALRPPLEEAFRRLEQRKDFVCLRYSSCNGVEVTRDIPSCVTISADGTEWTYSEIQPRANGQKVPVSETKKMGETRYTSIGPPGNVIGIFNVADLGQLQSLVRAAEKFSHQESGLDM
ncbi:MAG: hypothetical protein WC757_04980 [Candidatus Paceibacterota bacterium]|jgi:hypothetical protein